MEYFGINKIIYCYLAESWGWKTKRGRWVTLSFKMNYYQILQVSSKDSSEVIQAAYHRMTQMYTDNGSDEETMKLLNEAYEVLKNENSRLQYDQWLESLSDQNYSQQDRDI